MHVWLTLRFSKALLSSVMADNCAEQFRKSTVVLLSEASIYSSSNVVLSSIHCICRLLQVIIIFFQLVWLDDLWTLLCLISVRWLTNLFLIIRKCPIFLEIAFKPILEGLFNYSIINKFAKKYNDKTLYSS